MPLRDMLPDLFGEDADLCETLFNQLAQPGEPADRRAMRADQLADAMFGDEDHQAIVRNYLIATTGGAVPILRNERARAALS